MEDNDLTQLLALLKLNLDRIERTAWALACRSIILLKLNLDRIERR